MALSMLLLVSGDALAMPAMKGALKDTDIWKIILYLRSR